jgi:hypothetical protein
LRGWYQPRSLVDDETAVDNIRMLTDLDDARLVAALEPRTEIGDCHPPVCRRTGHNESEVGILSRVLERIT